MRLRAIALATIVLLGPIWFPNFASAIAPGETCTKVGKTTVQSGLKFFCVKKNGKLAWSKGVKTLVKETPKPSPTPSVKVLTALEKLNLDIYKRYQQTEKKINPSFNFVRCPNVESTMATITENAYIDAYSFWAPIYKATAKVNWLLMSEKDWICWYESTVKFEGANSVSRSWNVWNKDTGLMGHCNVSANSFCGYGTGVREGGIFAQYNMIGSNYRIAPTPEVVHHEIVHIYQAQLMADFYQTSKLNTVACWFMEGQANLFGAPISSLGDPKSQRDGQINQLLNVYPKAASYSKNDWVGVLNNLKTNTDFCFNNGLGYSLGWLALEWTYMNFTIEDMHDFLLAIAKGSTWEQAIQIIFKMDEQTYFSKIGEYLAEAI